MMDRRAFLAAAPLVFGLDRLLAQEPGRPDWIDAALRRMKDTGRFGLVLAVPPADPLQKRFGAALWSLTRSDLAPVRQLLAECVVVCARPAAFGVRPDDLRTAFLLAPDGAVLDGAALGVDVLEDGDRFATAVDALLQAEGRRAKRAEATHVPADVRRALDRLDAEEVEERVRALAVVESAADGMASLLAQLARTAATAEARGRAGQALQSLFQRAQEASFGPRLPYGARIPRMRQAGCGGLVEEREGDPDWLVAIKCGKAAVNADEVRLFLRFLAS